MKNVLQCGRFQLDLNQSPIVMGILNLTPDSFSDGGQFNHLDHALRHAEQMLAEGVGMIDIGGESTRPNAPYVSPAEELDRVMPVLEKLKGCPVPISLDTRRASVMKAALQLGAIDLINDVSALEDEGAVELAAQDEKVAICLMHKQGNPDNMQLKPQYQDVVEEVGDYLKHRVAFCLAAGIDHNRLLGDPGFGFGKTLAHNLALLNSLEQVEHWSGVPQLVGMSRKSMIGTICHEPEPQARLGGSLAAMMVALQHGAKVVRVHDVKASVQVVKVFQALQA